MEELTALLPLGTLTAGGLLGIAVLLILTGRLVPRRILQDKQEEADKYRKAWEVEQEAGRVRDGQMATLTDAVQITVEHGETTVALLRAMRPEHPPTPDNGASVGNEPTNPWETGRGERR